jgi:transcription antitermination protein NusB
MANRHIARSIVLQTLFEIDFRGYSPDVAEDIMLRDALEFAPDETDLSFMRALLVGTMAKRPEVDLIITKAAPDWPLDKISNVDRNILRIGLYELLFSDKKEVPAKVAINEAIELAKSYGGGKSSKFVNGVLGSIYREMGEPGKDEVSKKKAFPKNVPFEKMPIERLGGAVVYAMHNDEVYLAFVHDVFGFWTLSKGRIEAEENEEQGTIREIKEEIGLDLVIKGELGRNEYIASHPEKGKLRKQVHYYLGESEYKPLVLEKVGGGLDDAKWFKLSEIEGLNLYNDILPLVTKAIKMILGGGEEVKEETPVSTEVEAEKGLLG